MRRQLVSILLPLLVVSAPAAHGQVAARYVGVAGGATSSDVSSPGGISSDSRWGATAGLVAGTVTFDYSFIELGPSWMQAGGGDLRLDYLDVPLLVGALVPIAGRDMIFRLYGGIGIGFKLGCSAEGAAAIACDLAKGSAWSIPLGASFAKELANGKFIGLDARYGVPLSDAFELGTRVRPWQFRLLFGTPIVR